jgi:hypothetical protein
LTAPPSADDPVVLDQATPDRMEADAAPAEAERPRHRERERERERPRRERGNSDAIGTLAGVAGTAAAVSGFKNMFGLGRKKTTAPEDDRRDRRRTAYETEDERKRRKRSTTRGGMTEDEAKRLRHERRNVRKTTRAPDAEPEPMMTGANGSGEYDPEREARRAARRARHEQDKEGRRAEPDDSDARAKKARQMAELERRNKLAEEELRRMAEKDKEKDDRRKSRLERKPTDDGTREHRSSRRKDSDKASSRPNTERRRSHQDDDAERRRRHEERRAARRNSEYPTLEPINDYFDERNAAEPKQRSSRRAADEEQNQPYINKGPDKTSSWVQSLSDEPPLPPPISETVLDPPPGVREAPVDDEETPSQDEDIRLRIAGRRGGKRDKPVDRPVEKERERARDDRARDDRKHRRKSQFDGGVRGPVDEVKKDKRRSYAAPTYEEPPVRTWDGRPALDGNGGAGKRGSWLKKLF